MRRSIGFDKQCYGNGSGHGYGGMWGKSQDQMQRYDEHEESWHSHNSGMNMKHGGGGFGDSEYSGEHHSNFGGRGSHSQLHQGWHGGNGSNKWHNASAHHQQHQLQQHHQNQLQQRHQNQLQHGYGGKFNSHFNSNSNSGAHYEYESEDGFEFESYSSEGHGYPGAHARVDDMRYEHHNLGHNMNWKPNAGRKVEWLIKGV